MAPLPAHAPPPVPRMGTPTCAHVCMCVRVWRVCARVCLPGNQQTTLCLPLRVCLSGVGLPPPPGAPIPTSVNTADWWSPPNPPQSLYHMYLNAHLLPSHPTRSRPTPPSILEQTLRPPPQAQRLPPQPHLARRPVGATLCLSHAPPLRLRLLPSAPPASPGLGAAPVHALRRCVSQCLCGHLPRVHTCLWPGHFLSSDHPKPSLPWEECSQGPQTDHCSLPYHPVAIPSLPSERRSPAPCAAPHARRTVPSQLPCVAHRANWPRPSRAALSGSCAPVKQPNSWRSKRCRQLWDRVRCWRDLPAYLLSDRRPSERPCGASPAT